jgi:uncharacterized surface protein with fasciclin (FAS1) repeats
MQMVRSLALAAALAGTVALPAAAQAHSHGDRTTTGMNIVETARGAGSFTTLLAALEAAGLDGVLAGKGPFTVFAPTDEAFAKLPAGTVEGLLANPEQLTQVLTYHVVPGRVMASDVIALTSATTVQGQDLSIDASNGVKVDGATVIQADVAASNGVIHVIDSVLIP